MINFTAALEADQTQIIEWLQADLSKKNTDPSWWLTGTDCIMAFCVSDASGPVMYVRMDRDGEYARLNTLFAPIQQVSKKRMAEALVESFPALREGMKNQGFKGIVFESASESLVAFMARAGFKPRPEVKDDYVLDFPQEK